MPVKLIYAMLLLAPLLCAQNQPSETKGEGAANSAVLVQILERLNALEKQNQDLLEQVRALKAELSAARPPKADAAQSAPTLEERVAVTEQRTAEQAQTKVEASQKFPLSIHGMLLFNAFANGGAYAADYGLLSGPSKSGATLTQTSLGLEFQGPALPGAGKVNGSVTMDFWGAHSMTAAGTGWFRIREAELSFDWQDRSFSVGQMKPLISPLQPTSLAEVAVSPLAGAGNLWLWIPQARYEERLRVGSNSGITGQAAVLETDEQAAYVPADYAGTLERARPGLEGRLAIWHKFGETRRIEIGGGFHVSDSRVAGHSIASRIASLDWSIIPFSKLQLTGSFYHGQNAAPLGSLGPGFLILRDGSVQALHTTAGWSQVSVPFNNRLTFNLFSGLENDSGEYGATRNFTYAANAMYHFGPNVVLSLEALQARLRYMSGSSFIANHFDLGLAYLF